MKRITCSAVALLALGLTGCYVPSNAGPQGRMWLCVYTEDTVDITMVINASGPNGEPLTDDTNGAPYVDYITSAETEPHKVPNECESPRPYHQINLKADVGTTIHASIRVTGPRATTRLDCVYYVNGVMMPASHESRRNEVVCRLTAKV